MKPSRKSEVTAARDVAFRVLRENERSGALVRELLDQAIEEDGPRPHDRCLATDLVYGVVRRKITLDYLLARFSGRPVERIEVELLVALRMGLYQLLYHARIPARAAVNETVNLVKRELHAGAAAFANAILRNVQRSVTPVSPGIQAPRSQLLLVDDDRAWRFHAPVLPCADRDPVGFYSVHYGHPRWLVRRWLPRFGPDVLEAILSADNCTPGLSVRWRGPGPAPQGYRQVPDAPGMYVLEHSGRVQDLPGYSSGEMVVQGLPSYRAVKLLDVKKGTQVLDVCAGPGVKAMQVADETGEEGLVIAVDKSLDRTMKVRENAQRLRIINVRCVVGDAALIHAWLDQAFHRILVDVPCSNTGEFARRVEARHRLRPGHINRMAKTQAGLLSAAATRLAPQGVLVYATCSLEEEEGPEVTHAFTAQHDNFSVEREEWYLPQANFGAGGYAARIARTR